MRKIEIYPSIMCCKIEEYKSYIELFEKVQIQSIHFDVMDGHYVKNMMLGTTDYKDIKRLSKLPVDVHFMCYHPEYFIDMFDIQSGDSVAFHPETTEQPYKLLQTIKEHGCKAGLAINPGTPLTYIEECIDLIDYVILMTVNPGFAGQKMVPSALSKIWRVKALLNTYNHSDIQIIVDGNTTADNSKAMCKAGADIVVAGSSSIIKGLDVFEDLYYSYKKEIEEAL